MMDSTAEDRNDGEAAGSRWVRRRVGGLEGALLTTRC